MGLFKLSIYAFVILFAVSCNFKEQIKEATENADLQMGDQYFKTAISLIELHKTRFGTYPESLDSLKYTSDFDNMIRMSVKYQKTDSGYTLDLVKGWVGKPKDLNYPDEFWKGLGLRKSNLKKQAISKP